MSRRTRSALLAAALLTALASRAAGDPAPAPPLVPGFWHVGISWTLTTPSGTKLEMPPAFILAEPNWTTLDLEMKRLQTAETRLTAENKSMRASLSGWQPGFYTLATVIAGGIVLGWYAHDHL